MYTLFLPPLLPSQSAALRRARQVALVGPGDVFVFSGANAHMALSVSAALSITAYESFVNLHPTNLRVLLDSGTPRHYRQCRTRQPMLDDIKLDIAEALNDVTGDLEEGELADRDVEAAVPTALEVLRTDDVIARKVLPLRQKRPRYH